MFTLRVQCAEDKTELQKTEDVQYLTTENAQDLNIELVKQLFYIINFLTSLFEHFHLCENE